MIDPENNFHKYEVGGAVRDQLLGKKPKDIDFTCVYTGVAVRTVPEIFELLAIELERDGHKIFVSTPQFFTLRARTPEGKFHDFVLARVEGPYTDGRRPDWVAPGSLDDDLARRDFTINAMAREGGITGCLIDPFDGLSDLKDGVIRCVGNPHARFMEDPLRVLRALRFKLQLGFEIEDETWTAILCMKGGAIAGVSKERRRDELEKMFQADRDLTLDELCHNLPTAVYDEVMAGIKLRPCFTFKGLP